MEIIVALARHLQGNLLTLLAVAGGKFIFIHLRVARQFVLPPMMYSMVCFCCDLCSAAWITIRHLICLSIILGSYRVIKDENIMYLLFQKTEN